MPFKINCLREDYRRAPDDQLDLKATAVKEGLAAYAITFPSPPVSPATMATLIGTFVSKRSAFKRGGLDQKPPYDAAKFALLNAMDSNADYVDYTAGGDQALIVEAGYVPTKAVGSPVPTPERPINVTATRGIASGEMFVECEPIKGADFYGLIVSEGVLLLPPPFVNGQFSFQANSTVTICIDINKSRKKHLQGLALGVMYYFYMYAGNANGISPLSAVIEKDAATAA